MNRLTVFEIAALANLAITHGNKTEDVEVMVVPVGG